MKPILCLSLFLASLAWADEAVDRASIAQTISWINASYFDPMVFTPDFPDMAQLRRGVQENFEGNFGVGHVAISKEPWGEATWFPIGLIPAPKTPRFVIQSVRFITLDVATAEGIDQRNESIPVLFLLKKDGIGWRIASFKRLQPQVKTAP